MSNTRPNSNLPHDLITTVDFLERTPPYVTKHIRDLYRKIKVLQEIEYAFSSPDIEIYCMNRRCKRISVFRLTQNYAPRMPESGAMRSFISYTCSNCDDQTKTFALQFCWNEPGEAGTCVKFGELPEFGPPSPDKLMDMVRPDLDNFSRGRRCENQGLGIGAFAYYRRVVESQKNRMVDEIIRVAVQVKASDTIIATLKNARNETQFKKALQMIKVPESLLISGQNPIALLHAALSAGLHDRTDEDCLERATSIRVLLAELSIRISQALKDDADLARAIAHLSARSPKAKVNADDPPPSSPK